MHHVELLNHFYNLKLPSCSIIVLWPCYLGALAPAVPSDWSTHLRDYIEAGFFLSSISFYHPMLIMSPMAWGTIVIYKITIFYHNIL